MSRYLKFKLPFTYFYVFLIIRQTVCCKTNTQARWTSRGKTNNSPWACSRHLRVRLPWGRSKIHRTRLVVQDENAGWTVLSKETEALLDQRAISTKVVEPFTGPLKTKLPKKRQNSSYHPCINPEYLSSETCECCGQEGENLGKGVISKIKASFLPCQALPYFRGCLQHSGVITQCGSLEQMGLGGGSMSGGGWCRNQGFQKYCQVYF